MTTKRNRQKHEHNDFRATRADLVKTCDGRAALPNCNTARRRLVLREGDYPQGSSFRRFLPFGRVALCDSLKIGL